MKKLLMMLLCVLLLGTAAWAEGVDVPQYEGYNLIWNEEFDGEKLSLADWNREVRREGWTNNELQAYRASEENIFIRDGKLVLKAVKTIDEYGKPFYTSGKVQTLDRHNFQYGRVDVRARVPEGKGLWPAIWMMPARDVYGSWPRGGEIDIMEVLGHNVQTTYGTLHFGDPHAQQQGVYRLTGEETFANSFHVFSVEWDPGEFRFYVDGNLFHTVNDWYSRTGSLERAYPAPFNQEFYIQLNLAVGGNWPGNPDETTDFDKAEFEIDYVRVYQRPSYDTNVIKPTKQYREPTEDGNLVHNGDFAKKESVKDKKNWVYYQESGGGADVAVRSKMIVIDTRTAGTKEYSVQLYQAQLPMRQGQRYRLSFDAWADEERKIITTISAPDVNWIRYFPDTAVNLGTERATYTYEFTMTAADDNNGRIEFNLGNCGSVATVYITNVRVEAID